MRGLILAVSGVCMLAAVPAGAGATERPQSSLPDVHQAFPGESYTQYYRRGYGYRGYGYYGGGPYYYRRDNGAAVAAGVAGLAAGALIAGAIANQAQAQPAAPPPPGTISPSVAAYCARRYRSYDPASGTYLSNDGMRYVCTYP